jgi:hypothetical protein
LSEKNKSSQFFSVPYIIKFWISSLYHFFFFFSFQNLNIISLFIFIFIFQQFRSFTFPYYFSIFRHKMIFFLPIIKILLKMSILNSIPMKKLYLLILFIKGCRNLTLYHLLENWAKNTKYLEHYNILQRSYSHPPIKYTNHRTTVKISKSRCSTIIL